MKKVKCKILATYFRKKNVQSDVVHIVESSWCPSSMHCLRKNISEYSVTYIG
jgi:hypothetical protein